MINRDDVMDFFRYDSEDLKNLHSLSTDDKYELIFTLANSDFLYKKFKEAIDFYESDDFEE